MLGILTAAFFFNLGQGVLRPSMPLYLQQTFGATYRMVTLIPMVFGAGKWAASLPTGHLMDRLGRRRVMVSGLVAIACCDVGSVLAPGYAVFLGWRALAGAGWAMFGTVATTAMVDTSAARRARRVSTLLMAETVGLLLGSAAGGWMYQGLGPAVPFGFEAACMLAAAAVVGCGVVPPAPPPAAPRPTRRWRDLVAVLRIPGVVGMGLVGAGLIAVQTGVIVFLLPLYLLDRAGLDPATVGLLVSVGVLGRLLALVVAGSVAEPEHRRRGLRVGLGAYAVLLAGVTFLAGPVLLGLWSLALGAAAGFVGPMPAAIVGDVVAPPERARAIGWLRTMTDTGQILGPLVLGTLADAAGITASFVAGAALLAAAAGVTIGPSRARPAGGATASPRPR
jgi:MFS family permease